MRRETKIERGKQANENKREKENRRERNPPDVGQRGTVNESQQQKRSTNVRTKTNGRRDNRPLPHMRGEERINQHGKSQLGGHLARLGRKGEKKKSSQFKLLGHVTLTKIPKAVAKSILAHGRVGGSEKSVKSWTKKKTVSERLASNEGRGKKT